MSQKIHKKIRKLVRIYQKGYGLELCPDKLYDLWISVTGENRNWFDFETFVHNYVIEISKRGVET